MTIFFIKAIQLILSLSILVILHEFGHFIFAKLFKCRVEKFYLFFDWGFSLFKLKKGETEYGIGWLPLGGYVKISGMIDESMDKEQMKQPPQPWEFRSKTTGQRLLIMIGGVVMNFIAALIIYIGVLYAWGEEYLPNNNVKYGISATEVGREIGFMSGDKILSVDNIVIEDFHDIISTIVMDPAKSVQVERNGEKVNIEIDGDDVAKLVKNPRSVGIRVPFSIEVVDIVKESKFKKAKRWVQSLFNKSISNQEEASPAQKAGILIGDEIVKVNGQGFEYQDQYTDLMKASAGKGLLFTIKRDSQLIDMPITLNDEGLIGIQMQNKALVDFEYKTIKYGFWESIPAGIAKGWQTSADYLKQFKLIFNKKVKGYESLGGFGTIGSIFPAMWNWQVFWNMTAFLSIILAIMNILPIPALDGGHVMFVLYEMITGRKPNERFLEYAQYIGLSILLLLVLYANINDLFRFLK